MPRQELALGHVRGLGRGAGRSSSVIVRGADRPCAARRGPARRRAVGSTAGSHHRASTPRRARRARMIQRHGARLCTRKRLSRRCLQQPTLGSELQLATVDSAPERQIVRRRDQEIVRVGCRRPIEHRVELRERRVGRCRRRSARDQRLVKTTRPSGRPSATTSVGELIATNQHRHESLGGQRPTKQFAPLGPRRHHRPSIPHLRRPVRSSGRRRAPPHRRP